MFEIFHYDFMVRAFVTGAIVAVIAPLIGIFLVVRRYSLIADTLAHVSLLGVASALFLQINPIVGALFTSVLAAFGMEALRGSQKIFGESVLALFLSGSLAIALILISLAGGLNANFFGYLFGSITTISSQDFLTIAIFSIVVFSTIVVLYKKLFLISFDEELAAAGGLPVKKLNVILVILAAITVSLAMRVVGILLVGALMVIPVVAAIQLGLSFFKTILFSIIISFFSVVIGLYASYYLNFPSGGTIVIVTLLFFVTSLIIGRKKQ